MSRSNTDDDRAPPLQIGKIRVDWSQRCGAPSECDKCPASVSIRHHEIANLNCAPRNHGLPFWFAAGLIALLLCALSYGPIGAWAFRRIVDGTIDSITTGCSYTCNLPNTIALDVLPEAVSAPYSWYLTL